MDMCRALPLPWREKYLPKLSHKDDGKKIYQSTSQNEAYIWNDSHRQISHIGMLSTLT